MRRLDLTSRPPVPPRLGGRRPAGLRALAGAAGVVILLGACSGSPESDVTLPAMTPAPDPVASQTPEPTPTPQGPVDRSDEALGLSIDDLPTVEGDARAALDAYTLFELRFWESLVDGKVHPEIATIAASDVVDLVQAQVDGNAGNGWSVGGDYEVEVDDVQANESVAVITGCTDPGDIEFTKDGRTQSADDFGMTTTSIEAELTAGAAAGWQVTAYRVGEKC